MIFRIEIFVVSKLNPFDHNLMSGQISTRANEPAIMYDIEMEEVPKTYIKGYPSLAAFIASDTYHSTAIYRRFARLSARNLLHLQSDLTELEARQDALDREYLHSSTDEKVSARNWQALKERATEAGNVREKERLEVAMDIRCTIRDYSHVPYIDLAS